jgi:hypothetical protein
MRLSWPWAVLAGLLAGGLAGWWVQRESPEQRQAKMERAQRAAAATAEDARPVLYRWEDRNGTVHYSDNPPRGHTYERVDREPRAGIEVRGTRQ